MQLRSLDQRVQRRRDFGATPRLRAVVIFAPYDWTADRSFGSAIPHPGLCRIAIKRHFPAGGTARVAALLTRHSPGRLSDLATTAREGETVTTGQGGSQFHRFHRYPGDHFGG